MTYKWKQVNTWETGEDEWFVAMFKKCLTPTTLSFPRHRDWSPACLLNGEWLLYVVHAAYWIEVLGPVHDDLTLNLVRLITCCWDSEIWYSRECWFRWEQFLMQVVNITNSVLFISDPALCLEPKNDLKETEPYFWSAPSSSYRFEEQSISN